MTADHAGGLSLAFAQDGMVVFAGGFGVRELGKPEKVDAQRCRSRCPDTALPQDDSRSSVAHVNAAALALSLYF